MFEQRFHIGVLVPNGFANSSDRWRAIVVWAFRQESTRRPSKARVVQVGAEHALAHGALNGGEQPREAQNAPAIEFVELVGGKN